MPPDQPRHSFRHPQAGLYWGCCCSTTPWRDNPGTSPSLGAVHVDDGADPSGRSAPVSPEDSSPPQPARSTTSITPAASTTPQTRVADSAASERGRIGGALRIRTGRLCLQTRSVRWSVRWALRGTASSTPPSRSGAGVLAVARTAGLSPPRCRNPTGSGSGRRRCRRPRGPDGRPEPRRRGPRVPLAAPSERRGAGGNAVRGSHAGTRCPRESRIRRAGRAIVRRFRSAHRPQVGGSGALLDHCPC